MYATAVMSLCGVVLMMLIATGAMVSGQQSMSYMQYCSVCMPSQNQDGIIITVNSDHYIYTSGVYNGGLWGLEHPPVLPDNHETNRITQ